MFVDTAPLLALLKLDDKFSGPLKNANKTLGQFDSHLSATGTRGFKAGQQIGTGIRNGIKIAVGAFAVLSGVLALSVKEGQEAAKVQAIYATAIANSGKVSQAQVGILNAQQKALMSLAGVDDELIKSEQTRLIQMGLTGAQVAKLTPLILDVAKATGKDLLTVTLAVGKAVNGNTGALGRLGIVLPKATKAVKSQALATLEARKAQLDLTELQDKARGPLTKAEKAFYAHAKAVLAAEIAQQKLTDSTKKTTKATSDFETVQAALNSRFGGTTQALSTSLEARLGAFREALANIREEAGIKLLPVLTRIVDVAGRQLVPAFGKFVDRILPFAISGLDKLAKVLEGGAATRTLESLFRTAESVAPALQQAAEVTGRVVKTAVDLFKSLPPGLQTLLVAGLAVNKLTGGLVTNVAGGLADVIGKALGGFAARGSSPANPVFVSGIGGLPGGLGGGGATGALGTAAKFVIPVAIAAVGARAAADLIDPALNAAIDRGEGLANRDPRRFNSAGQVVRNSLAPVKTAIDETNSYLRLADRHTIDATGETTSYLRLADRHITDAIDNNTSVTKAGFKPKTAGEARKDIEADRRARGIKDTGPSTSINPRLGFLAGSHLGTKDVAVANALATGFERGATPLFRTTKEIPRAIAALKADQHQLLKAGDTKNAGIIGGDIKRLQAELGRRVSAAKAAIDKLKLNVTIPITSTTLINGRLVQANFSRYTTVVGGHVVNATGASGV